MPLTPEQQDFARQFILSRCGAQTCAACGSGTFDLTSQVVRCPVLGAGQDAPNVANPGSGTPMVELICQNCGCVRHFSAVTIGLYTAVRRS